MTQTNQALADVTIKPAFDLDGIETIDTRFGELTIDKNRIITFTEGLYGLEEHRHYVLTSVTGWPDSFKLLQSLEDPELSLIVLPLEISKGQIEPGDVAEACMSLGFDENVTIALGIVTMRADSEANKFTVNLKAPVLVDTARRLGRQHVFASDRYRLRHALPLEGHDRGPVHGG